MPWRAVPDDDPWADPAERSEGVAGTTPILLALVGVAVLVVALVVALLLLVAVTR